METALSLTTQGLDVPTLAALAAWSEERGYRTAWLSEVAGPDAFVLATAVAGVTKTMDIGVAVVPAYTRTPTVLSMAAGSVSQALKGRTFRLGIGSSSETIIERWNGLSFERPLTRVRETVEAVRQGLGERGDYEGKTVAMRRYRSASRPAGPVSIFVAALGPKMLQLAGNVGDGVCLNMMPARVVPKQMELVGRGIASRPDSETIEHFEVMARLQVAVTDDPPAIRQMAREMLLGAYLAQPVYNAFLSWIGYEEEAAAIAKGWATRDKAAVHAAIHDRLVDDLVLIGSVADVRQRLEEFGDVGVDQAAVSVLASDRQSLRDTLAALVS